jgi:hypothetical protein
MPLSLNYQKLLISAASRCSCAPHHFAGHVKVALTALHTADAELSIQSHSKVVSTVPLNVNKQLPVLQVTCTLQLHPQQQLHALRLEAAAASAEASAAVTATAASVW